MAMNIALSASDVPSQPCPRLHAIENSIPRVVTIVESRVNTNGIYSVLPFREISNKKSFGNLVMISRFGVLKSKCTTHSSYKDNCSCSKLINTLIDKDVIFVRDKNKRVLETNVSSDTDINHDDNDYPGDDDEVNESRLFHGASTKRRPLKNNSLGHKPLSIHLYKSLLAPNLNVPNALYSKKECTCGKVNISKGIFFLNSYEIC